jgi:predicted nuclease of predicted toxin-antitoxin system
VKIIIDAQLPPALATMLCEQGADAVAVRDIGLRNASDSTIWLYALKAQAAIVTKDEDFVARSLSSQESPVIIWLRIGNSTNRALQSWVLPLWPEILRRITAGDRLIEVR